MTRLLTIISTLFLCIPFSYAEIDSTLIDSTRFLNNQGVKYLNIGDYEKADLCFRKSLDLKKQIYEDTLNVSIAHGYNNIGVSKMRLWKYDSALIMFSSAEKIYSNIDGTNFYLANLNSNRGNICRLKGDFNLAKQYYLQALSEFNKLPESESAQGRVEVLKRLGLLEEQRNNISNSIEYFEQSLLYKDNVRTSTLINLYENLGYSYLKAKSPEKSEEFFLSGIKLSLESSEDYSTLAGSIYQKLALLYSNINKRNEAISCIKKARDILDNQNIDSTLYLELFSNYGNILESFQEFDSAAYYYHSAININAIKTELNIYHNPSASNFQNIFLGISQLKSKAQCLINWNSLEPEFKKLSAAIDALETAVELIDLSRNSYQSLESKLLISENENPIYKMGLFCASELYKQTYDNRYLEKAFYFAEKNKSAVLASELQEGRAKIFGNIPPSLLDEENTLKREISFYSEKLYEESMKLNPDSIKISTWNRYLFEFSKQQEVLRQTLESKYPDYYSLKYKQSRPSITDIQKIIRSNTSIIEYTLTDSILYVFNINKNDVSLTEVDIDSIFLNHTYQYLNYFRNFSFLNQGRNTYDDINLTGSIMYDYLITPIESNSLRKNVIFVPDDILSYLPFEALTKPGKSDEIKTYSDLDFLIKHHAISYSYSASLLHDTWSGSRRRVRNKLLAIAPEYNPISTKNIVQHQVHSQPELRDNLLPIPFAMEEAKTISDLTNGKSIVGNKATEYSFREQSGEFDILHLAMHTVIDDNNPLFSKLVFYDEDYASDNGLLTTNEIFALDLKAQMIVLSSCSSGEGEIKKGEGVLSLARGFFYAGCPSLVMTLWQVEDKSGLILMENYYKYLLKGHSKPVALQKAKIKYINSVPNEKRHPFYWSAYISIGNPSPIYVSRFIIYLISGSITFMVILFFIRWKNRKKLNLTEPKL